MTFSEQLEIHGIDDVTSTRSAIPSLIKWTGSKRSQALQIVRAMPPYRRYIEPFVGSGAVLFLASVPGSIASDIYEPLIELWRLLQRSPRAVTSNYRAQFSLLAAELNAIDRTRPPKGKLPEYFYHVRDRFNCTQDPLDLNFIMRTCVNGIVRFNDKGEFNNSFHLSRRGMEPHRFDGVVRSWRRTLANVEFLCQDYGALVDQAKPGDFLYFDPPYAGNKQRYAADLELDRFFAKLDALNGRGINWALSFDGRRGHRNLVHDVPESLFKRHLLLASGNSAVGKVLNGPVEVVEESLYLNY